MSNHIFLFPDREKLIKKKSLRPSLEKTKRVFFFFWKTFGGVKVSGCEGRSLVHVIKIDSFFIVILLVASFHKGCNREQTSCLTAATTAGCSRLAGTARGGGSGLSSRGTATSSGGAGRTLCRGRDQSNSVKYVDNRHSVVVSGSQEVVREGVSQKGEEDQSKSLSGGKSLEDVDSDVVDGGSNNRATENVGRAGNFKGSTETSERSNNVGGDFTARCSKSSGNDGRSDDTRESLGGSINLSDEDAGTENL